MPKFKIRDIIKGNLEIENYYSQNKIYKVCNVMVNVPHPRVEFTAHLYQLLEITENLEELHPYITMDTSFVEENCQLDIIMTMKHSMKHSKRREQMLKELYAGNSIKYMKYIKENK